MGYKELKGLAPFSWDKRKGQSVGKKSLADFELV